MPPGGLDASSEGVSAFVELQTTKGDIRLYQTLLRDASFYDLLARIDEDLAETTRVTGCACGGRLHQAHYRRKPRGGPSGLCKRMSMRLSFCCSQEGCRRRRMPPSLRFLGRKVFFSVVVLLVPVLREGPTVERLRRLEEEFQVSERTARRWQRWWREEFCRSPAMNRLQGLCAEPIRREALPGSMLQVFGQMSEVSQRVLAVLRVLSDGPSVQIP